MAPLDKSCTTSYQSAIVSIPYTVSEISDVEYRDLEILVRLGVSHSENLCTIAKIYRAEAIFLQVIVSLAMGLSSFTSIHRELRKKTYRVSQIKWGYLIIFACNKRMHL